MEKAGIVWSFKSPLKRELARAARQDMTPAEKHLWIFLRANRLNGYHFRRQQPIDGFRADFYCHAAGLIIEVDGEIHETQTERDAHRTSVFEARGFTVLRFTNEQVLRQTLSVLNAIAAYLPPAPTAHY